MKHIVLVISLLCLIAVACQESVKVSDFQIAKSELTKLLVIDSMNYMTDAIMSGDLLFITGFTFRNGDSSKSKLVCFNTKTKTLEWDYEFNKYYTNKLTKLSIIGKKIYVTGVQGKEYQDKETRVNHVNLHPTIAALDFSGKLIQHVHVKQSMAYGNVTALTELNGQYYFSYHTVDAEKFGNPTFLMRLSEQLDVKEIYDLDIPFLNEHALTSLNDRIYVTGIWNGLVILVVKESGAIKNLTENRDIRHYLSNISKCITYKKQDAIHFVAIGKNNIAAKEYNYLHYYYDGQNETLKEKNVTTFPDSIKSLENFHHLTQGGHFSLKSNKNEYTTFSTKGKQQQIHCRLTGFNKIVQILYPENPNKTIYLNDYSNSIELLAKN